VVMRGRRDGGRELTVRCQYDDRSNRGRLTESR
jgi:hypothetical protein